MGCVRPLSCLLCLSPPSATLFIRLSQGHPKAPQLIGLSPEAKRRPDALETQREKLLNAIKCLPKGAKTGVFAAVDVLT